MATKKATKTLKTLKASASRLSLELGSITLEVKPTGKPLAGNPHERFDVAGAGNGLTVWLMRHSQRKRGVNR